MDRQEYDDYKNIIRKVFNLLVQKYDLPLRIASIGITPAKEAVTLKVEDTGVIRFLNDQYGPNWPTYLTGSQVFSIDFSSSLYEYDFDSADKANGIDVNESHDVKVWCRVGKQLIGDWKTWRSISWPDVPLKN